MSDPAQHTDGLATLQARRAKRTRTIPKSQNPTTLPPYQPPAVVDLTAEEARGERPAAPTPQRIQKPEPASAAAAAAKQQSARKTGLYLDEAHEDFMEAVRIAGNALRPRVNLTASSVARLAMDRLMAEMTADQVRDALVAKPVDPSTVGRRRR
jgi:hypothetical protein